MKEYFSIVIFLFLTAACFATDLLVVGKDTFYLKTYPLKKLHLKYLPFDLQKKDIQAANAYPGYQAVWRISGGKLYLEKIISVIGNKYQEEDIAGLFKKNAIRFKLKGNLIVADWLSITYYPIEPYQGEKGEKLFLGGSYDKTPILEKALVQIKKGIVTFNKLPKDHR